MVLLSIWAVSFAFLIFPAVDAASFKAGVAKVVITPDYDMWMSGYASRDRPSEGKVHDLHAKALALQDGEGNRCVLLTTDLIGLPGRFSEKVATIIEQETGLPRAAIMLTSSHTHSGPVLRDDGLEGMYFLSDEQWERVDRYMRELETKLVSVILSALDNLEPAQLFMGKGTAGFAINRRQYNLDNISIGHNPIGPVDHDVPTLKVVDANGKMKAVVFGYACHNTTLSFYQFCGDYAGYAQYDLEEQYPDALALFWTGCGADANPNPRRELAHAIAHGKELSKAVQTVLNSPMKEVKGPIRMEFSQIDLPLTPAPTREKVEEDLKSEDRYIQSRAKKLMAQLDRNGKISETYSYPLQVWRFNDDIIWIAMAGEVVVDYALRLKHELGQEQTWVTGYANDVFAYIPSLRVLREGGYEVDSSMIYYGLHGPWKPEVEKLIVEEIHRLMQRTKAK
jgi:hypothetical protein